MGVVVPVIPVGPGEIERQRLVRVVRSLVRHEPALEEYVVVLDRPDAPAVAADLRPLGPAAVLVPNTRGTRACVATMDGLACGLTAAFAWIVARRPGAHVWKIDTDAHVIGPCRDRIAAYFAARPAVGQIGTLDHNPDGTPRAPDFARMADVHRKALWPAWWWQSTRRLTTRFAGPGRRAAAVYREFARAGGVPGRYVQGGSYALNGAMLLDWQRQGRLADPHRWLGTWISEDVGFSMWAVASGYACADFNTPGQVFGVHGQRLVLPPAELVARGYGVVHSVKAGTWEGEQANVAELDDAVLKGTQMNADERG